MKIIEKLKKITPSFLKNIYIYIQASERTRRKRNRLVSKAKSIDEVRAACESLNFTYFLDYDTQKYTKQREFKAAIKFFEIDLKNKCVLDIGPGTADSLDVAKESGASITHFIEEEPVFIKFSELKGHSGDMKNYYVKPYFPKRLKRNFDFIYTKGSINCAWVNENFSKNDQLDGFCFSEWVDCVKDMLKDDGEIILVPAMGLQNERVIDAEYDLDTYYWCPDIDEYKKSPFTKTLIQKGFSVHESIPGFTHEMAFPLAFYFKNVAEERSVRGASR